jgi:hypothetical protein
MQKVQLPKEGTQDDLIIVSEKKWPVQSCEHIVSHIVDVLRAHFAPTTQVWGCLDTFAARVTSGQ